MHNSLLSFLFSGSSVASQNKPSTMKSDNKFNKSSAIAVQPVTYVWAGKEYTMYPSTTTAEEPVPVSEEKPKTFSNFFVPRQLKHNSSASSSNNYVAKDLYSANTNLKHVDESSYINTISHVRTKISNVSLIICISCYCIFKIVFIASNFSDVYMCVN